jgi:KaiC/GvpD/RAD55 family RecA-like ATPase
MTTTLTEGYAFEDLSIDPIPAGTNLLVAGPPHVGTSQLVFELLGGGDEEGLIFVAADDGCTSVVETYEQLGHTFDPGRMCIIDATHHEAQTDAAPIRHVGSPSDLTGIGMQFSSLYESLRGSGITQVRVGLQSISTLLVYAEDFRSVYRFLHTITSRIRTADGLGVFAVNPDAVDEEAYATIAQTFDAQIDVRESEGGSEFRIKGLDDQPDGWQSL